VLHECKSVRADLGYPMMITPYSQFVGTQAAIHVATGQRWQTVIDPLIRFAQGAFGEDSGYTYMDENLRDRVLDLPQAKELAARDNTSLEDVTLEEARAAYGGPGLSDEDLLLRAIMQGSKDVDAMHAAGPPRSYTTSAPALVRLVDTLREAPSVRYVQVSRGSDSMTIANRERPSA
jgi:oxaloacetate decarboxylase alpha subunit